MEKVPAASTNWMMSCDVRVARDGTEIVVNEITTQRVAVKTNGKGRWDQLLVAEGGSTTTIPIDDPLRRLCQLATMY